ncbi:MAG: hypothetical protein KF740_08335 [Ramlibacter sp.]|nr:hypothetical protein [Ramlibacter sp.]
MRKPLARALQVGALAAALLGALACAAAVYDLKLTREVAQAEAQLAELGREASSARKLQDELDGIIARVGALSNVQPRVLQVQALARLASSGLIGEAQKVVLVEWEYRNDRVKMLFAVPPDHFVLGDFLADIEKTGVFSDIRLLPGTPGISVGLQAGLKRVSPIISLPPVADESVVATSSVSLSPLPGRK